MCIGFVTFPLVLGTINNAENAQAYTTSTTILLSLCIMNVVLAVTIYFLQRSKGKLLDRKQIKIE